jgi:hypothetical protein
MLRERSKQEVGWVYDRRVEIGGIRYIEFRARRESSSFNVSIKADRSLGALHDARAFD